MAVTKDQVVTLHYTLHDGDDKLIESSVGEQPMTYLHGHGQMVPGLEDELDGRQVGDKLQVTIEPAQAYGEYDENLRQAVPKEMFGEHTPEPGMSFQAQTDAGMEVITVREIQGDKVVIDANHPFAGVTLKFDVEIVDSRAATEEELAHGHAHAAGGCCGGHDHEHEHAHDDDHECCGGTGACGGEGHGGGHGGCGCSH